MNTEQARFNMIEQQVRPWQVLSAEVLHLLSAVKREHFVPEKHRTLAFADTSIPLGEGQFMLPPKAQARLVQDLGLHSHERVLEVGTGSGYCTAMMAHLAAEVISFEQHKSLADVAFTRLRAAGLRNVRVVHGQCPQALGDDDTFDAILLTGSVASVPQTLLARLRPGGRLLALVGTGPVMQATLVRKTQTTSPTSAQPSVDAHLGTGFSSEVLWDYSIPRLSGFEQSSVFSL